MNVVELIASGKLELYVTGSLSKTEALEVEEAISIYPNVKKEIEQIEASLIEVAKSVAPTLPAMIWTYILKSIDKIRAIDEPKPKTTNWTSITGWAAALICMAGIFWMLRQNNSLRNTINITTTDNTVLKDKVVKSETQLAETNEILEILRSEDYATILLPGNQAVAPTAFAKVYYNKKDNIAYIDAKGLPNTPIGKVYQVWSLLMNPLTPTSVGLLDSDPEKGIFKFDNIPTTEAFGITLEPEGGSETPTLSQLYTLGVFNP